MVLNEQMEKVGSVFNWTLDPSNTLSPGMYKINGIGDIEGVDTNWGYEIEVTPSGSKFTSALSIPLFLPMILMSLIAGFFLFLIGFVEKDGYKYTFMLFSGFFFILTIAFGIIASREVLVGFPALYSFINSFYRLFVITLQVSAIVIPVMVMFYVIKKTFSARGYHVGGIER